MYTICRRIVGPDDAQDACQEAMLAVTRGLSNFDGRAAFTTWLYRVTANCALDESRRQSRRAIPIEHVDEPLGSQNQSGGFDESVATRLDVDAALRSIPTEFRVAVTLRDVGDLDYATIADMLDVPIGTVRSRIARGRSALAHALGNQCAPTGRPSEQDHA